MTVSHVGAQTVLNINFTFLSKEAEIIVVITVYTMHYQWQQFVQRTNNNSSNNNNNNMI
jgi:hypothetical protein